MVLLRRDEKSLSWSAICFGFGGGKSSESIVIWQARCMGPVSKDETGKELDILPSKSGQHEKSGDMRQCQIR